MNCTEFQNRLDNDGAEALPADAPDLQGHRASCASCRARWDGLRLLAEAIPAWRAALPHVELSARVLALSTAAAPEELPTSPRSAWPDRSRRAHAAPRGAVRAARWLLCAATAGLALIAALVAWTPPARREKAGTLPTAVAHRRPAAPPVDVPPSDLPTVDPELIEKAEAAYDSLASRAAGAFEQLAWIMLPRRAADKPADAADPAEDELPAGWQRQLRPIGRSVEDTFDFLWQIGQPPDDSRT